MSTPSSHAGIVRGGLVGACSALITALAHAAGGGGIPSGSALVEVLIVCATVGAGVGAVDVAGRHARVGLIIAALCAGQGLGHLVLTAVASHDHPGSANAPPWQMLSLHVIAAVVAGLLIGAVEYLYVVCSAVLTWLRLFATAVLTPQAYVSAPLLECRCRATGAAGRRPWHARAAGAVPPWRLARLPGTEGPATEVARPSVARRLSPADLGPVPAAVRTHRACPRSSDVASAPRHEYVLRGHRST